MGLATICSLSILRRYTDSCDSSQDPRRHVHARHHGPPSCFPISAPDGELYRRDAAAAPHHRVEYSYQKKTPKNAKPKTATRRPSHISERVYLHDEQPSSPRLARYILHMHRKPPPVAFAYPHQRHSKATHRCTSRDYPQSHSNKLLSSRIFMSSSRCILRTQIFA
jgi:hypothetical protein